MKKIFIIEDDEEIKGLLEFNLKKQGYNVVSAADGYEALSRLQEEKPDLILLDIMLPELDGYEICRTIRYWENFKKTPVIMLTAKSEEIDVVLGLELGADDYVTKPFSVRELLSRIKAHLRRNEESPKNVLQEEKNEDTSLTTGEITIKLAEHKVFVKEKPVNLTHKEFELLKLLMSNKGRVLKRDLLLEKIWGYDTAIDTRTVDVHIRYLRQKIEEDPANPRYIKTIRGVGYFIDPA
ncbi:MAG: response regulator transcription factor [Bacillota bacterium]